MGVEDVFEAGQHGDRLLARRCHYFVWCALRDHLTILKHNDAFAQGENFLSAVSHIENRYLVRFIPGAKVVDNF